MGSEGAAPEAAEWGVSLSGLTESAVPTRLCNAMLSGMGSDDDLNSQKPDVTSQKPTVKTFHDDIGVLNQLQKLASEGVPKTALHVFAHDAESTDEVVGTGGTLKGLGELVAERYNERGDELRNRFQRYGFDSDEIEKFESDLDNGAILLVIDDPELRADYKGNRRAP